jgi:hypothetical protein
LTGKALFLVESKFFDVTKEARVVAAQEQKWKAVEKAAGGERPAKCARTSRGAQTTVLQEADVVNVNTRELGSISGDMDIPSVISQPVPANSTNTCFNNPPVEPSGVAAAKKLYEAER